MPALKKTDYVGSIIYLGVIRDRAKSLRSEPVEELRARFAGIHDEDHSGLTRASCARVTSQYPKGTEIRNTRQICIVSQEEMAQIARAMDCEGIQPEWIGANIMISGLPDFSHLPPSARLQTQNGTTLTIDMENRSCHLPAPFIDKELPGFGGRFKAAAKDLRGVTAWVEREGSLHVGDDVVLHIPDQRPWDPNA